MRGQLPQACPRLHETFIKRDRGLICVPTAGLVIKARSTVGAQRSVDAMTVFGSPPAVQKQQVQASSFALPLRGSFGGPMPSSPDERDHTVLPARALRRGYAASD